MLLLTKVSLKCCFLSSLQNFYLWKKDKKTLRDIKDKDKEILIKVTDAGNVKLRV